MFKNSKSFSALHVPNLDLHIKIDVWQWTYVRKNGIGENSEDAVFIVFC
jgi:hypothetical protein